MGAYSELDLEQKYGNDPFIEDDPFVEDDAREGVESVPAVPARSKSGDTSAVQTQANQVPPAAIGAAQPAIDKAAVEDAKRKAHEAAEAQRKAEWEARQQKKKQEEQAQLDRLAAMSNEERLNEALKRVHTDTEKLTRRNMMECVMELIQTMCMDDPAFAQKVMHPRKNMIRCYQYINRKAWEFVQDEMKAKGIKPGRDNPYYASSIPDDVCYQWAVDYFNDPDAKEDHEEEEKFVPNPYRGPVSASTKKSKGKEKTPNKDKAEKVSDSKASKPAVLKPSEKDDVGQISFGDFAMPEEKAG